jgi:NAD(P)-dependent dehydrogenase (short-subunit alcohol dehydrogenase family)
VTEVTARGLGRLREKVAVVTGAAKGIGRATAELFAREGARLVITDVDLNADVAGDQRVSTRAGLRALKPEGDLPNQ